MNTLLAAAAMVLGGAVAVWLAWWGAKRGDRSRASAGPLGLAGGVLVVGGLAVATSGLDNVFGELALWLSLGAAAVLLSAAGVAAARVRPSDPGPSAP